MSGAWEWYEQQQPGLGDRFVAAVGVAIARLRADRRAIRVHRLTGDLLHSRGALGRRCW